MIAITFEFGYTSLLSIWLYFPTICAVILQGALAIFKILVFTPAYNMIYVHHLSMIHLANSFSILFDIFDTKINFDHYGK